MTLQFYYGSGSPYAWRAHLALEHKQVPYEAKLLSFSDGDLRKPEYLALNPRHKVPTLVDDGFALYESGAIIEYLEERFPDAPTLYPGDVQQRAVVRRLYAEADNYLGAASTAVSREISFKSPDDWDMKKISKASEGLRTELQTFEGYLGEGPFFVGEQVSAADYTVYPFVKLIARMGGRLPQFELDSFIGNGLQAWMQRVEALPHYDNTYPPHWRS